MHPGLLTPAQALEIKVAHDRRYKKLSQTSEDLVDPINYEAWLFTKTREELIPIFTALKARLDKNPGNAGIMFRLGKVYDRVFKKEQAKNWLKQAAEAGHMTAHGDYAAILAAEGNHGAATPIFKMTAEYYPRVYDYMAITLPLTNKEINELLEKGIAKNCNFCLTRRAINRFTGRGYLEDIELTIEKLTIAATKGNSLAIRNFAALNQLKHPKEIELALKELGNKIKNGSISAFRNLAILKKHYHKEEIALALKELATAAANGNSVALRTLASQLQNQNEYAAAIALWNSVVSNSFELTALKNLAKLSYNQLDRVTTARYECFYTCMLRAYSAYDPSAVKQMMTPAGFNNIRQGVKDSDTLLSIDYFDAIALQNEDLFLVTLQKNPDIFIICLNSIKTITSLAPHYRDLFLDSCYALIIKIEPRLHTINPSLLVTLKQYIPQLPQELTTPCYSFSTTVKTSLADAEMKKSADLLDQPFVLPKDGTAECHKMLVIQSTDKVEQVKQPLADISAALPQILGMSQPPALQPSAKTTEVTIPHVTDSSKMALRQ